MMPSVRFSTSSFFSATSQALQSPITAVRRLESCGTFAELRQFHAHVLRRHHLITAFHWNALMRAYLRLNIPFKPIYLLIQMTRFGEEAPDRYSLPIALKAASRLFAIGVGSQLQTMAIKLGIYKNEFTESGIISVYGKCGDFESARKVFDENPERKIGSWNAIINSLAQAGRLDEAVNVFVEMRRSGIVPDEVTMVSVVSACGGLGDIGLAEQVHKCVLQAGGCGRLDAMLSNSLVDMYAKCGRTDLALRVFSKMTRPDVCSWTAMIMGLAVHGEECKALDFFRSMQREGVQPNQITFVGVLSACAHGGLVDEGMMFLEVMETEYRIKPMIAHFGCVVDMLGRVGRLQEALAVVKKMPMKANAVIWGTLLGACEKHGNVEVGEFASKRLMELEPWNHELYAVLSNIYAKAEMWSDVERMRKELKARQATKIPGYSLSSATI